MSSAGCDRLTQLTKIGGDVDSAAAEEPDAAVGTSAPAASTSAVSVASGPAPEPPTTVTSAGLAKRAGARGTACKTSVDCTSGLACIALAGEGTAVGRCQRPCPRFANEKCDRNEECLGMGVSTDDPRAGPTLSFCVAAPKESPPAPRPARSCPAGKLPVTLKGAALCVAPCATPQDCASTDVCREISLDDGKATTSRGCVDRTYLK